MNKQKRSGFNCMYKNCGRRASSDTTEILKFHRVPKDETMWVKYIHSLVVIPIVHSNKIVLQRLHSKCIEELICDNVK